MYCIVRLSVVALQDPGDFEVGEGELRPTAVVFFIVLTVAVNVVMLNVLITIVGESYTQAQANRAELSRRTLAGTILDIEAACELPVLCPRTF
eukprot:SAG11_NODE_925_length_6524_cov_3.379300_2_plen_93_part_00